MNRSLLGRAGIVSAASAVLLLTLAGPASAHVTVNPKTATQGGYTKVSFRVPTESDTLSTTKVEVNLPADTPIASVSLKPVSGWTAATVKSKLSTPLKTNDGELTEAVTKITWTADANAAIKPGQFQEFDVSLGRLPKVDQLVFKALQTYSDGSVVRWIDEPADGAEAEHPAPVLKLTAAEAAAGTTSAGPAVAAEPDDSSDDDGNGSAWGIAGLVAGLAGLVLGLLAYRRAAQPRA